MIAYPCQKSRLTEASVVFGGRMHTHALSLLAACGVFQVAMGVYFIALRPTLLVEDERFIGLTLNALTQVAPAMPSWLDRVFVVLGGHAVAAGLLMILAVMLLWNRAISLATLALIVCAGIASMALMSAVNFAIHSNFRWLLLLPVLLWACAVLLLSAEWTGGRSVGHANAAADGGCKPVKE